MWNPRCFGNPGKVSDTFEYACSTADGGGVHTNSGVPNHAFALMVDGGSYNGQTITGIGLTKAAHIYFRAADVYQGPASNFEDHADALEASAPTCFSCPADLTTGLPSGESISALDVTRSRTRCSPSRCACLPRSATSSPSSAESAGALRRGPDPGGPVLGRLRDRARRLDGQPRCGRQEGLHRARLGVTTTCLTRRKRPRPG